MNWARISKTLTSVLLLQIACFGSAGCRTVRPEERAILADPVMRFDAESAEDEALQHALENREGSYGGGSVQGGGCGCN